MLRFINFKNFLMLICLMQFVIIGNVKLHKMVHALIMQAVKTVFA